MSEPFCVAVVGPLPPPLNGMSVMTEVVLSSPLGDEFALIHVDTSDHRSISRVARFDLVNVVLAFVHFSRLIWVLIVRRPAVVYLPIARNRLGFLRDALLLVATRLARRRCLIHFHGRGFGEFYARESAWMQRLIRLAIPSSSHAIVLGRNRLQEFDVLLPRARVHVLPNGIPDPAVRVSRTTSRHDDGSPPAVLHLSTLRRAKGVFDVLEVLQRTRNIDSRFILAGPWYAPSERVEAEAFLREHDLAERVSMTGAIGPQEKSELFACVDVFLFPTRYAVEGHPLVVLEAMSHAIPVVAHKIGCMEEMIQDGVEGFLIDVGDMDAMTRCVLDLLNDSDRRRKMGAAARTRFEREFRSDLFAERLARIFREVLDEPVAQ